MTELETESRARDDEIQRLNEQLQQLELHPIASVAVPAPAAATASATPDAPAAQDPGSAKKPADNEAEALRKFLTTPQGKLQLMRELQVYEETCSTAQQWHPDGPSATEDLSEYQFALKNPSVSAVRALTPPPIHERMMEKLRVKKGLFHRSGFHPMFCVLRERFLYYFSDKTESTSASGSIYLLGCQVRKLRSKCTAARTA